MPNTNRNDTNNIHATMIRQTWKICTTNVQGINDPEKFDDVIQWIETEDFDITILTETKLNPTKANFIFNKKNKKYVGCWTQDYNHSKSTGIGIILKKSTVGKHKFKVEHHLGRIIQTHLKFKGKITITITDIYRPADHSDKETKNTLTHIIHNTIHNKEKHLHIVTGDLNEDDLHHTHTPILNILTSKGLYNANADNYPPPSTWTNHHPINTIDFHILFKKTWHKERNYLYAMKKKKEHTRIIEAIKKRET